MNARRVTDTVNIGGVPLGSEFPIRVQSMVSTPTEDIHGSMEQCIRIIRAGADYVRFTVPAIRDVSHMEAIRKEMNLRGLTTPIIADVHFNASVALQVASHVDKIRINPGNFADSKKASFLTISDEEFGAGLEAIRVKLIPLIDTCRQKKVAIRIGVNHGSLSERIMSRYGDTIEGMAESAMEYLRICREEKFDQVVVSMKASNIRVMVQSTHRVVERMKLENMHFPLHLGVTEAGEGEDGRIKSAAGIGSLLADGLGDTIRVSLTEDPEAEIPVARCLVNHISGIFAGSDPFPVQTPRPAPGLYYRHRTRTVLNIGGNQVPVVVGDIDNSGQGGIKRDTDQESDYQDCPDFRSAVKNRKGPCIIPYTSWKEEHNQGVFPYLTATEFCSKPGLSERINFVEVQFKDLEGKLLDSLQKEVSAVMVYRITYPHVQAELRNLQVILKERACEVPVIFRHGYDETEYARFQIRASADFGTAFIEGFGDGLWLSNACPLPENRILSTSFGILQACRSRITRTEYISCPSCGRTNFNLIDTLARIKSATSHLKGLKIGVMGCIVNGPGEMADADYGYVGAGKGRITLYKAKQVIDRGIPEDEAVEKLIALIRKSGDWVDP